MWKRKQNNRPWSTFCECNVPCYLKNEAGLTKIVRIFRRGELENFWREERFDAVLTGRQMKYGTNAEEMAYNV